MHSRKISRPFPRANAEPATGCSSNPVSPVASGSHHLDTPRSHQSAPPALILSPSTGMDRRKAFHARGVSFVLLATICGILDVDALASPFVIVSNGPVHSTKSVWRACVSIAMKPTPREVCNPVEESVGDCVLARLQLLRYAGIGGVLLSLAAAVPLGIADVRGKLPAGSDRVLLAVTAAVLTATQFVCWATLDLLWTTSCDGTTPLNQIHGARSGPPGALYIVAWLVGVLMVVVASVIPAGGNRSNAARDSSCRIVLS